MTTLRNPAFDATVLRRTVLETAYAGFTVHIGCAFSIIGLLAVSFRNHLRYPGNDPQAPGRDYFSLSKGHGVMAQYASMRELGWLKDEAFTGYFADGSDLKGLSDSRIPGLEVTSGSLGHEFSVRVRPALGAKLNGTDQRTYALVGDGELNEGPIWEGALFVAHNELKNFMVIVDENGFQAMVRTDEVLGLGAIQSKFESFGFEAITVDGYDETAIDEAIRRLNRSSSSSPKALIGRTIKGKGVPFMEDGNIWHYPRLNPETYQQALAPVAGSAQ